MHAPRLAPPATSLVRLSPPGRVEGDRVAWSWHGTGPAHTSRGLAPLQVTGAAPSVTTPHGPGIRIERGTVNLAPNPSFEVDLAGWSALAGASIGRETTGGAAGDAFARVEADGNGQGIRLVQTGNAAQGDSYAASVHVRAASPSDIGKSVQMFLDGPGGTYEIFPVSHVLTGTWARVAIETAWAQAGHSGWGITVRDAIGQGAFVFDVDTVQYEPGGLTSYADGDRGPGHAWQATAHASPSVRQEPRVESRLFGDRSGGAFRLRCIPAWDALDGEEHVAFDLHRPGGGTLLLEATAEGDWALSTGGGTVAVPQAHAAGALVQIEGGWDARRLWLRVNGVAATASHTGQPFDASAAVAVLGSHAAGGRTLGGVLLAAEFRGRPMA